MHILTKDKDEKQLSAFYGWLYEGERNEEEERLVAEAAEIQELMATQRDMMEED